MLDPPTALVDAAPSKVLADLDTIGSADFARAPIIPDLSLPILE